MSSSFQQLASCMALRAFPHSPPPYSCRRKQKHSVLIYPCACGIYIPFKPIAFQELRSYLTSHPSISFYFHFMYTPQHRTASVVYFLSIPHTPFMQSVTTQAIFLRISSGMFLFSATSYPQLRESKIRKGLPRNYPEIVDNQYKTKVINHIKFNSICLISTFTSTIDCFHSVKSVFCFSGAKVFTGY